MFIFIVTFINRACDSCVRKLLQRLLFREILFILRLIPPSAAVLYSIHPGHTLNVLRFTSDLYNLRVRQARLQGGGTRAMPPQAFKNTYLIFEFIH